MGFEGQTWPEQNLDLKTKIGLIWKREQIMKREEERRKRKRRGGRGRREEEEEEKPRSSQQGMETHLNYEFYETMYKFPCLVG